MKALLLFIFPLFFLAPTDHAPIVVELQANGTTTVSGNLNEGHSMDDLSWAWDSSNACFPATQKQKFTGSHVLYTTIIPKYTEMEVKVIPRDPTQNFSIYAYEVGVTNESVVPDLPSCIRCEVDHKWDRPHRGKTQDHTRTAKNLIALSNSYRVVVGVVGAEGLSDGAYDLEFIVNSRN